MAGALLGRALRATVLALGGAAQAAGTDAAAGAGGALPDSAPASDKVVRIACVGDSITEGFKASSEASSYPSVLQAMLGPDYFVMNFGHSGATLTGPQPEYPAKVVYSHTPEYTSSLQSDPDLVVIMIGSNDATSWVWPTFQQDFEPSYAQFISVYQALPTRPLVFIAVPPPLYKNKAYGMLQNVINTHFPQSIRRIAHANGLPPAIPVFEAFKGRCPDLISDACPYISGLVTGAHDDGCHPNDRGYLLIAQAVQTAIAPLAQLMAGLGAGAPGAPPPPPALPAPAPELPAALGAAQAAGADLWAKRRRLRQRGTNGAAAAVAPAFPSERREELGVLV